MFCFSFSHLIQSLFPEHPYAWDARVGRGLRTHQLHHLPGRYGAFEAQGREETWAGQSVGVPSPAPFTEGLKGTVSHSVGTCCLPGMVGLCQPGHTTLPTCENRE